MLRCDGAAAVRILAPAFARNGLREVCESRARHSGQRVILPADAVGLASFDPSTALKEVQMQSLVVLCEVVQRGSTRGPPSSEKDWRCPKCGNWNFQSRSLCNRCHSVTAADAARAQKDPQGRNGALQLGRAELEIGSLRKCPTATLPRRDLRAIDVRAECPRLEAYALLRRVTPGPEQATPKFSAPAR